MTAVVLDDHLLRDLLADELPDAVRRILTRRLPATTNLYYQRLCRSAVNARGTRLTGSWSASRRRELGATLVSLPGSVEVVPMRDLSYRMAELAASHGLSTLGAEAVAAAEHLGAPLYVWEGDDGPRIQSAARAVRVQYRTVAR